MKSSIANLGWCGVAGASDIGAVALRTERRCRDAAKSCNSPANHTRLFWEEIGTILRRPLRRSEK
jgi:hypothetical protein